MDFSGLACCSGFEVEIDGAGFVEMPDLAEIGHCCGVGGIREAVAGWNLEPIADLERLKQCRFRRRFGSHDKDIGMKIGMGENQFALGGDADSAGPEERLIAGVEEQDEGAVIGMRGGIVGSGTEDVHGNAGAKLQALALLPRLGFAADTRDDIGQ